MVKKFECKKGFSFTISQISKKIPPEGMNLRSFLELMGERGRVIITIIYFILMTILGLNYIFNIKI